MNPGVYELTKIMDFYKSSAFWHHRTPANAFFFFFFEKRKTRVKIVKKCVKKSKNRIFVFLDVFCSLLMKSR